MLKYIHLQIFTKLYIIYVFVLNTCYNYLVFEMKGDETNMKSKKFLAAIALAFTLIASPVTSSADETVNTVTTNSIQGDPGGGVGH